MQYVYEKCYDESQENIIFELEPCGDFIVDFPSIINSVVKDIYKINCEYCDGQFTLEHIKTNQYANGKYLLCSDNKATLIEKTDKLNVGYLYNSTIPEIKKLIVWKLLSYKVAHEPIEVLEEITLPFPEKLKK